MEPCPVKHWQFDALFEDTIFDVEWTLMNNNTPSMIDQSLDEDHKKAKQNAPYYPAFP